jgi:hypothetical protein
LREGGREGGRKEGRGEKKTSRKVLKYYFHINIKYYFL